MLIAETERLEIRHFVADDREAMDRIFGDVEVMHYGPGVKDSAWVENWISLCEGDYRAQGFGLWAVVEKSTRCVIGYCGLTRFPDIAGEEEIEVGYRLARECWGKGYATEAARAVRDYGFETLKLPRLISLIDPENIASVRVAEKLGMHYEKDATLPGYSYADRVYVISVDQATK